MMGGGRRDWEKLQDRWAAGEPLSADEEARRQAAAASDPAAARELQALAAMGGLLGRSQAEAQAEADETLIEQVLERAGVAARPKLLYLPRSRGAASEGAAPPTRQRRIARATFGGLAAALAALAAVYAGVRFERGRHEIAAAARQAEARLASASGEVQVEQGRPLRVGDHLRTGKGSACLRVEPAIDVCVGPDSDVEIGSLRAPQIQILVARGVAIAALAPRAAGQSFALAGGDVVAVAHGTVYALDRTSAVSVDVVVLEGTVAVHPAGRAGPPDLVPAHTRWRSQTGMGSALRTDEEGSFAALLAPRAPAAAAPRPQASPPPAELAPRRSHPTNAGVDSPDECLARARAALDRGDRRAALDWYRRLRARFPNDAAARTVLVTSGRLELGLGASSRALEDFQAYLRGGDGALEMEALAGTARALRALGRVEDERRAIERYLARFPDGFDAPLLRSRRGDLERSSPAHASDSAP
jgi:tetratricopeptide (TPR) repeat protein